MIYLIYYQLRSKNIYLLKTHQLNILLDSNKKVDIQGEYAFNEEKFFPFDLENLFENNLTNLKVDADYVMKFILS